jgi:hypothetical protein
MQAIRVEDDRYESVATVANGWAKISTKTTGTEDILERIVKSYNDFPEYSSLVARGRAARLKYGDMVAISQLSKQDLKYVDAIYSMVSQLSATREIVDAIHKQIEELQFRNEKREVWNSDTVQVLLKRIEGLVAIEHTLEHDKVKLYAKMIYHRLFNDIRNM